VVLTLSIHTGDTNPPPHPGARLHPPMPQARLALLLCMPPVAALASLAIAALCSPESTAGYAIGSIAGSLPPLLMAAWPLWTLTLWATRRVPARAALLGGLGLLLMGLPSPTPAPRQPDEALVVITNVNAYSGEDAALEAFLARIGADAVVTIEQRGAALDGMVRVADNYDEPLPRPSHATAAYCRTSIDGCAASVTAQIGSATMKMPVAVLRIADTRRRRTPATPLAWSPTSPPSSTSCPLPGRRARATIQWSSPETSTPCRAAAPTVGCWPQDSQTSRPTRASMG
jgi:hypothetical protein